MEKRKVWFIKDLCLIIIAFDMFQYYLLFQAEAVLCSCIKARCIDGTCYCQEMLSGSGCSMIIGPIPTAEKSKFGKHFLFFDHRYVSWHQAKETCQEFFNGTLAMPSTAERHDFIYTATRQAKINERSSAIWLGFNDIKAEGHWVFEDGVSLNFAPNFFTGSTTVNGKQIKLPALNSTSSNENWHFYFTGGTAPPLDRDSMKALCNALGSGRLPYKLDHQQSQRLITLAPDIQKVWLGIYLQNRNDLTTFRDEDGDPVFLPRAWYLKTGNTVPSAKQLSEYQNWDYPPDPDQVPSSSSGAAYCVMLGPNGWTDESCSEKLVAVCAYGPFGFERWHYGGSNYSEPNNGLGNEDCGVIRLDIPHQQTHHYTDILFEFWNDYDCDLKFPFACETAFPTGCVSYQGPHTPECLKSMWKQYGCIVEGHDYPDKLTPAKRIAWNALNLVPLSWHLKEIRDKANSEEAAQLQCFGIGFPPDCQTFTGPHSRDCLASAWLKVGCKRAGFGYPGNASAAVNSTWKIINLRELTAAIEDFKADASVNPHTQRSCYGSVFPSGCTFDGPHSHDCLIAIWNTSGCVDEGLRHPKMLGKKLIEDFNALNLVDLIDVIHDTHAHSAWQVQAQLNCFGLKFPSGCISYPGPHTDSCLKNIWIDEGCLEAGGKSPANRSSAENTTMNALNIRELQAYVDKLVESAKATGQAQLDCYGLRFPSGCTSFHGPNPVACYNTIWLSVGCITDGDGYPQKSFGTTSRTFLNSLNLREIRQFMERLHLRANQFSGDAQLDCYGKKFPPACGLYAGPHSYDCQEYIWKTIGCVEKGQKHPSKLLVSDNATINAMTIFQLVHHIQNISVSAISGIRDAQLDCFGIEFPFGCVSYMGPYSLDCMNTIWNSSGCLKEGQADPSNVTGADKAYLDSLTLKQLLEYTNGIYDSAVRLLDSRSQLLCYGISFPPGCKKYAGPNSERCYTSIWLQVGCISQGHLHPSKLSSAQKATLDAFDLRRVRKHIEAIKTQAHYLDVQSQLDCFGLKFPKGCIYYRGPHPLDCLKTVWKEEKCEVEGYKYPRNITDRSVMASLHAMTLVQLRIHMSNTYSKAIAGDGQAQLECFGLKFPSGCNSYGGPNTRSCFVTIWERVGCPREGNGFPNKLSPAQLAVYEKLNLREVNAHIFAILNATWHSDKKAQLDCFGIEFLDGCTYYRGPHSLKCTTTMWKDVGCIDEGEKYPGKLPPSEVAALNGMNLTELRQHMKRFAERAEKGTVHDQLDCYGLGFSRGCRKYKGPHSPLCLTTLWYKAGCVKRGFDFPANLSTSKNATLNTLNIREVENRFVVLKNRSQLPQLNEQAQLHCFGLVFPVECTTFRGPHSLKCQQTVWDEQGCIEEGYNSPENISSSQNRTINGLNLFRLNKYVQKLITAASNSDADAQLKCFGLKYPSGCKWYRGPNSDTCYNSIWLRVGCTRDGRAFPSKLTSAQNKTLNDMTLREVLNYTEFVHEQALSLDRNYQLDCFGKEFPSGCTYYRGPHPLECQKFIWKDAGCLEVGYKYPENISSKENDTLHLKNLVQLEDHMKSFFKGAETLHQPQAQLDCFGLKFPSGCTTYKNPNPINCYSTIWKSGGCVDTGYGNPNNETFTFNDLREVQNHTATVRHKAIELKDQKAQLGCFGLVFPQGCNYYRGPHSRACLKSIWKEQGCLDEGYHNPKNLSRHQRRMMDSMTLPELQAYMKKMRLNASSGIVEAQLKCFGLRYLGGCKWYRGPNSVKCYENIWLDVGCIKKGSGFPGSGLTVSQRATFNSFDLRQIRSHIEDIHRKAIKQKDGLSQTECFGSVFPKGCIYYRGPHSLQCQLSIWASARCLPEGYSSPANLTPSQNDTINAMNLDDLKTFTSDIVKDAEILNDASAQLNCFGLKFPNGCKTYQSPNHVDCYNNIWSRVGCLATGRMHPSKMTPTELSSSLDTFNLRQIENYSMALINEALGENGKDAQLDCFGEKFPVGCIFYRGPHPLECQITIWKDVGCLEEGYRFPSNLTPLENATINALNLSEVRQHVESIKSQASTQVDSQLACYGLKFPTGCTLYEGPNALACYYSIWIRAGCLKIGHQVPDNSSSSLKATFDSLTLREIEAHVQGIRKDALSSNVQAQRDCFAFEFSSGCTYYRGPHPKLCKQTLWKQVGCLDVGYKFPPNITANERRFTNSINLHELKEYFGNFTVQAHAGDADAQLNCYGFKFPKGCTTYRGPYNLTCYESLWLKSGCINKGKHYPSTAAIAKSASYYNAPNIREINVMIHAILSDALSGNNQSQENCFGFVFPPGCKYYRGPHPEECQTSIWKDSGCLNVGYSFPSNISRKLNRTINVMNIEKVQNYIKTMKLAAESGDEDAQLNCFGMKFPNGCSAYQGPQPDLCYQTIWLASGCLRGGLDFPRNIKPGPKNATYGAMNLRQIKEHMTENISEFATTGGNIKAQYDCFGMMFSSGCVYYRGPHSEDCQREMWQDAGCLESGHKAAGNITKNENNTRNSKDLVELKDYFKAINRSAYTDQQAQLDCYGLIGNSHKNNDSTSSVDKTEFPNGCKRYRGPNPKDCYNTIFLGAGCIQDGYGFPTNRSVSDIATMHTLNLRALDKMMSQLLEETHNDSKAQLDCFGEVFPQGCAYYRGPHSLECQESIWKEQGCVEEGFKYPKKASHWENASMNAKSIVELRTFMQAFNTSALAGDLRAQLNCFGLFFNPNCSTYEGPHSDLCYINTWKAVGCVESGYKYPSNMSAVQRSMLGTLNFREVLWYMENVSFEALGMRNPSAQLDCFGLVFPKRCRTFSGPHPIACQEEIWSNVSCVKEGYRAPLNLTSRELQQINAMNLPEVIDLAEYIYNESVHGEELAQLDCYGWKFPNGCVSYQGPNPVACYKTIWLDVGCIPEGHYSPDHFTSTENALFDSYNLRQVRADMEEAMKKALSLEDVHDQLDCFGMIFPDGCTFYRGPHSLQCQKTIWKEAGCLEEGNDYPEKLTDLENATLNAMKLDELINYTRLIVANATNGYERSQLDCYGMKFPAGCTGYNGPQPIACHETIWKDGGCIVEGYDYPTKRSSFRKDTFKDYNLRDIESFTRNLKNRAIALVQQSQFDCYGISFPPGCVSYTSPHTLSCQEHIWKKTGCIEEGYSFPSNLTTSQNTTINAMNLVELQSYAKNFTTRSEANDAQAQLNCYGLKFPKGCDKYKGPLPVECHNTIWLKVGCIADGMKFPNKSLTATSFTLPDLDIRGIENHTRDIIERTRWLDCQSQRDCFGIEFPLGCDYYRGPHSLQCLTSIWDDGGCAEEGYNHPSNLSAVDLANESLLTIVELQEKSRKLNKSALAGNATDQLTCFGIKFPNGCLIYQGPNSIECYKSIWKAVGCTEEGHDYPDYFTSEENALLHGFHLNGVRSHMKLIASTAVAPNTGAQLDCYGLEFPPGCLYYRGPHPDDCHKYYWRSAGCVRQGWSYPDNRTYEDSVRLNNMTLRELKAHSLNFISEAENGSISNQLLCYGMKFPSGCMHYRGPRALDCYRNLWNKSGCIEHGFYYPQTSYNNVTSPTPVPPYLEKSQNKTNSTALFDALDLREVIYLMGNISEDALADNSEAQIQCYGRKFPLGCGSYLGAHSDQCLESMWLTVGCVEEGYCHPSNLSGAKNSTLRGMNLDELFLFMKNLSDNSLMSDEQSQLNCFGMRFPTGCVSYLGPHRVDCLNTIWKRVGCTDKGLAYPGKPNNASNITALNDSFNLLDLRQLRNSMQQIIDNAILLKNNKSQLDCFGHAFRDGCVFYRGPHPFECLQTTWNDAGCLQEGHKHPSNLSSAQNASLMTLTLEELHVNFKTIMNTALSGNADAQLECYGIKFPSGCLTYEGPHQTTCLNTLWKRAGCIKEGFGYPDSLHSGTSIFSNLTVDFNFLSTRLDTLNAFNLRVVQEYVTNITEQALSHDVTAQLDCFGQAFPNGCRYYSGPHAFECLKTIWSSVGCISEGFGNPKNYTPSINSTVIAMTLVDVEKFMQSSYDKAITNDNDAQLECYGIKFPTGCITYEGPHSVACLRTIWKQVGCVDDGPGNANISTKLASSINRQNLRKIRLYFKEIIDDALGGNSTAQLECFGIEFLHGCDFYRGPHTQQCLLSNWLSVGCLLEGHGSPFNLSVSENASLLRMNLRQLKDHMVNITVDARTGVRTPLSEHAQFNCYGLKFPNGCVSYEGPHHVDCLNTVWILGGCIKEGCSYPENLTATDNLTILMNSSNLRALMEIVENITEDAIKCSNRKARLDCFGMDFPIGCNFYNGPHSLACQQTLWREGGCLDAGSYSPDKVTPSQTALFNSKNLREGLKFFCDFPIRADNGSKQAQLDCYGQNYPENCTTYYGPHSVACYLTIWKSVGCLEVGRNYPGNMTQERKSLLDNWNILTVVDHMHDVSNETRKGNGEAQLDCYGIVFPCACRSYEGPHSLACQMIAWTDIGCVQEGLLSPDIISVSQNATLNAFNIPELRSYFQNLNDDAHNASSQAQLDCYGLEFPPGCDSYRGPHSMDCYLYFWNQTGCLDEGYDYPLNLSIAAIQYLDSLTLYVLNDTLHALMERAITWNTQSQLECFGMAFPCGCHFYWGPHSLECQVNLYLAAGCLEEGFKYPSELSPLENNTVKHMSLRNLSAYTIEIKKRANEGDFQSQCDCYGLGFPGPCKTYNGPHSIFCYLYLWKEAGCSTNGYDQPENLTMQAIALLNSFNIRELRAHMMSISERADELENEALLSCYGRYFPFGCDDNHPPHTEECLMSVWKGAGCEDIGYDNPSNLTGCQNDTVQNLKLPELLVYFTNYTTRARNENNTEDRLNCYGIEYPDGCEEYEGPNDVECYQSIWKDVGCIEEGLGNPPNLSVKNLTRLHSKDLRKVKLHMQNIFEQTRVGNNYSQLDCFGLVFPRSCVNFRGPHSVRCVQNAWKEAGCTSDGLGYSRKNGVPLDPRVLSLTLSALLETFRNLSRTALAGDLYSQISCYGMNFLKECTHFNGPHSDDCLNAIWNFSGCSENGRERPDRYSRTEKLEINSLNLRKVNTKMKNVSFQAFVRFDHEAQLDCVGFVFPNACLSYLGPHSLECLNYLFKDAQCGEYGFEYPGSLASSQISALAALNLHEVKTKLDGLGRSAFAGNAADQEKCLGVVIPSSCIPYDVYPKTLACYKSLFTQTGCIADGFSHPDRVTHVQINYLDSLTLAEVIQHYHDLRNFTSHSKEAQLGCFGIDFPFECDSFRGPLSLDCLNGLWIKIGCVKAGRKYPEKRPVSDQSSLSSGSIKDALQELRKTTNAALGTSLNVPAQYDCFGEELTRICGLVFRGPYSLDCYTKLWEDAKCIKRGLEYQANLSVERNTTFNNLNVYHLQRYMKELDVQSFPNSNRSAQMLCYGRSFPPNCKLFKPRIRGGLPCHLAIFIDIGCAEAGHYNIYNTSASDKDLLFVKSNLADVHDIYSMYRDRSFLGDAFYQLGCFGTTFSSACQMFYPVLTLVCLNGLWNHIGCTDEGDKYPQRLSVMEIGLLNATNITLTKEAMQVFHDKANHQDRKAQTDCYGFHFPTGCHKFDGPHSLQCQITVWLEAGCTEPGVYYPPNISDVARTALVQSLNLSSLIEDNKKIYNLAIDGRNKSSQVQCFGFEFPNGCYNHTGPYSLDCKVAVFEKEGCVGRGYHHPTNISTFHNLSLNRMTLYEMKVHMASIYQQANQSSDRAQLDCFGRTIPSGCNQFEGPHTLLCYMVMWNESGCVDAGSQSPHRITTAQITLLNAKNLNELETYMAEFFVKSNYSDDRSAQLACFGTTMAKICQYHPPVTVQCMDHEFLEAKCSRFGHLLPSTSSVGQIAALNQLNLVEIRNQMRNLSKTAQAGDMTARLDCYGLTFPSGCVTYRGVHNLACFESVWKLVGCGKEGRQHPQHMSYQLVVKLSYSALHEMIEYMRNISEKAAAMDESAQLDCYGRRLPFGCTRFLPPLALRCMRSLWGLVGCREEGYKNPINHTTEEEVAAKQLNIDELKDGMLELYNNSFLGNATTQLKCFGLVFPNNCSRFEGPLHMPCYISAWEHVGCSPSGRSYPKKRRSSEVNVLNRLNLRLILEQMINLTRKALSGQREEQLECFGDLFPKTCRRARGPFSPKCLEDVWSDVGCVRKGYKSPHRLTGIELFTVQAYTLGSLRNHFKTFNYEALKPNVSAQYDCYGLAFPDHCHKFRGILPLECYNKIWETAGCLKEGEGYPGSFDKEKRDDLHKLNLREIIDDMNRTGKQAFLLRTNAQIRCFGTIFPKNCSHYLGPHTLACFNGLWVQSGCTVDGYDYPKNRTGLKNSTLFAMKSNNLWSILSYMKEADERSAASAQAQLECYGMRFPNGCVSYRGPHSTSCLEAMWLDADCLDTGYDRPDNLSAPVNRTLQKFNLREIIAYMENIHAVAETSNQHAVLQCFGPIFPPHCLLYGGPHTIECVRGLWLEAGCLEEGHQFPSNLTAMQNASLNALNLREVYDLLKSFKDKSLAGDKKAQLDCYGMEFHKNCHQYFPILSVPCLSEIFKLHCIQDGTWYPGRANQAMLATVWNNKNQREAMETARIIKEGALYDNTTNEKQCYGLTFPDKCEKFYRDHSLECLRSIWKVAGCSMHGYKEPGNLTNVIRTNLMAMTIRQVLDFMERTYKAASNFPAGNRQEQLNCFGTFLTTECPVFHAPLEEYCLTSIWLGAGCTRGGIITPYKLPKEERLIVWDDDLYNTRVAMTKKFEEAANGEILGLLECFGVLPGNCTDFKGRLSVACLSSLWLSVGCKAHGRGFPHKQTPRKIRRMYKNFNIRESYMLMLKVLQSAMKGNATDQIACFGKTYPAICKVYESPLPIDCLVAVWNGTGCLDRGRTYPGKLTTIFHTIWETMDLGRAQRYVEHLRRDAAKGNAKAQWDCYGIEFLTECKSFTGPHTLRCYNAIWTSVGCIEEGYEHPSNRSYHEIRALHLLNRYQVEEEMREIKRLSNSMDVVAQYECYGFEFPNGCRIFEGPHPPLCLNTVLSDAGFNQYPGTYDAKVNDTLNKMTLKELIDHVNDLREEIDDELETFEPADCDTIYPPLTLECLSSVWVHVAGCSADGTDYPAKLDPLELDGRYATKTLKQVNKSMAAVRVKAFSPNRDAQIECFGTEINENCTKFHPTLSRRCLNSIWLYDVRCYPEGILFPGGLDTPEFEEAWGRKNFREAQDLMKEMKEKALAFNKVYQRQCHGRELPVWMYGITAATVKFLMISLASIVLLGLSYILYKLMTLYPRGKKGDLIEPKPVENISHKTDFDSPYQAGEGDGFATSDTDMSYSFY